MRRNCSIRAEGIGRATLALDPQAREIRLHSAILARTADRRPLFLAFPPLPRLPCPAGDGFEACDSLGGEPTCSGALCRHPRPERVAVLLPTAPYLRVAFTDGVTLKKGEAILPVGFPATPCPAGQDWRLAARSPESRPRSDTQCAACSPIGQVCSHLRGASKALGRDPREPTNRWRREKASSQSRFDSHFQPGSASRRARRSAERRTHCFL